MMAEHSDTIAMSLEGTATPNASTTRHPNKIDVNFRSEDHNESVNDTLSGNVASAENLEGPEHTADEAGEHHPDQSLTLQSEKLDALKFLDPDSPEVTEESIKRTVAEAAKWRVSSARSSSSTSSPRTVHSVELQSSYTALNSTFDASSGLGRSRTASKSSKAKGKRVLRHWNGVETPNDATRFPIPPYEKNHRPRDLSSQPIRLHRAKQPPLGGYAELADRLASQPHSRRPYSADFNGGSSPTYTATSSNRQRRMSQASFAGPSTAATPAQSEDTIPPLRPLYRRFEALNHRLLLHLQDELAELEEQLYHLDEADVQMRRFQHGTAPASRRADNAMGGELQWHRTDVLGKIGYKMGQYNQVLSSFTSTLSLPTPVAEEIETYKTFLATEGVITDVESRFLDAREDLVDLRPLAKPDEDDGDADPDTESVFFDNQAVDDTMPSSTSSLPSPITPLKAATSEEISGLQHPWKSHESLHAWLPLLLAIAALLHGIGLAFGPGFTIRSIFALLAITDTTSSNTTASNEPLTLSLLAAFVDFAVEGVGPDMVDEVGEARVMLTIKLLAVPVGSVEEM